MNPKILSALLVCVNQGHTLEVSCIPHRDDVSPGLVESASEIPAISIVQTKRHAVVMGRDLYIHFGKHWWLVQVHHRKTLIYNHFLAPCALIEWKTQVCRAKINLSCVCFG